MLPGGRGGEGWLLARERKSVHYINVWGGQRDAEEETVRKVQLGNTIRQQTSLCGG